MTWKFVDERGRKDRSLRDWKVELLVLEQANLIIDKREREKERKRGGEEERKRKRRRK